MAILHWKIDPQLKQEAEDNYRTRFALGLKDRDALTIIRELTFDGVVPNITIADIERLFDFVERNFLKRPLAGTGVEVGAGPLPFSCVLAKRPGVEKMYGIEICQPIVEHLFPKIAEYILGEKREKAVGVVGSFDEMELPDASVDFVFDFYSLHHSMDINVTLKECARILKPGGFVLCFDKARPDQYTYEDLSGLLDVEYGNDYKKQFGLPLDQKLTRRLNGEREYRLSDWRKAFLNNGFQKFEHANLAQTKGGRLSGAVKSFLAGLPVGAQLIFNRFLPAPQFKHKFVLSVDNRVFSRQTDAFRKDISLMIVYR